MRFPPWLKPRWRYDVSRDLSQNGCGKQADVVMMSDEGTRGNLSRPGMQQQGMGFLMMHRDTGELLAAASLFGDKARRHQHLGIEGSAVSSRDDNGSTDRRGRAIHRHTSKRIHTARDQDARNQSGNLHAQMGGRQQMNTSGSSAQSYAWADHAAMPGHPPVPRMQRTLGNIRSSIHMENRREIV